VKLMNRSKTNYTALVCIVALTSTVGTSFAQYWDRNTGSGYVYPATLTDNVGIGTTNPGNRLYVTSTVTGGMTGITTEAPNFPAIKLSATLTTPTTGALVIDRIGGGGGYGGLAKSVMLMSDQAVQIAPGNTISATFLPSGNVGIGTTNPGSFKLAVEGKVGAREVVVTQAAWSDFVFKDDYKLKPLAQVADYVKKNKHLEGVPTEAEVKKNGISIGEMQAKLLEKVEELTLHVIAMKKENDELKAKVGDLERKIER
jgi:hypothetical protein